MLKQLDKQELMREMVGGEVYEYCPLGKFVVMAPGVCGSRPTFKYTRLETSVILADIAAGYTIDEILQEYSLSNLSRDAVLEAINLANQAFVQTARTILPIAA